MPKYRYSKNIARARTGQRWTRQQQLRFLELLLEASRDGLLESSNGSKAAILKSTLEGFIPSFEKDFPQRGWTTKVLENKYRQLLAYWRVFKEAGEPSGAIYDPETGKITISKAKEQAFKSKHPVLGPRVISQGLVVNDVITFDAWDEIFGSRTILSASDDEGSQPTDAQDDDSFREEIPRETPISSSTPKPSITVSQATRYEATLSRAPTARGNAIFQWQQTDRIVDLLKDIVTQGSSSRSYVINTRVPGAADLEKAIGDCMRILGPRRMPSAIRIVAWLKDHSTNPLVWNSLGTVEAKIAWVEQAIGLHLEARDF